MPQRVSINHANRNKDSTAWPEKARPGDVAPRAQWSVLNGRILISYFQNPVLVFRSLDLPLKTHGFVIKNRQWDAAIVGSKRSEYGQELEEVRRQRTMFSQESIHGSIYGSI